jgi:hypothetical protein
MANKLVDKLLQKIIAIMRRNISNIQVRMHRFHENSLEEIQKEIQSLDKYLEFLKHRIICKVDEADAQETKGAVESLFINDQEDALNRLKTSFFLNLFNFLVLYNLTILLLSNPDAVEHLTNYNMWQSFLNNNCWVQIHGNNRINAYTIMHSVIRGGGMLVPAGISQFLLDAGLPYPLND